jgi:hypothetical protein
MSRNISKQCMFVLVIFVFCVCAVSVIGHLAVGSSTQNKELNWIIITCRLRMVSYRSTWILFLTLQVRLQNTEVTGDPIIRCSSTLEISPRRLMFMSCSEASNTHRVPLPCHHYNCHFYSTHGDTESGHFLVGACVTKLGFFFDLLQTK